MLPRLASAALLLAVAACGRVAFEDCVDECDPLTQSTRCAAGIQQICADVDADACFEWGWDVACTSGACADADTCTYSTCSTTPVGTTPSATAPGSAVCSDTDPGFPWKLVEKARDTPVMIDGRQVTACVMVDYGATCAPRQICVFGTAVEALCADDCGGAPCAPCPSEDGVPALTDPLVALVYVFASATPDLERFESTGVLLVQESPASNGVCIGISPFETRYVLVCRPACGPQAWNVAVGGFQLAN